MTKARSFDIFLATAPGLEEVLAVDVRAKGFKGARAEAGGVTIRGGWPDVWRANLEVRGASRIIAGIDTFPAQHLNQLERRARDLPWHRLLRADVPFRVEATCKASRIYHSGAAAERVERAIAEALGAPLSPDAAVCIRVRLENDLCSIGVDTSGELLHKRGHKEAVAKAPMRETMASLFLLQCGFRGREPVLDPMCGSGTFVIEAAEMAAGLKPGRSRQFAFEKLATFDEAAWQALRGSGEVRTPDFRFYGSDRDAGAIRMSQANAERAGVSAFTRFNACDVRDLVAPEGPPGLVITNAPYGDRVGKKSEITALYRDTGRTLAARFQGWRVGLITTEATLAKATGLPFAPPGAPVSHGGLRVKLFQTGPLK